MKAQRLTQVLKENNCRITQARVDIFSILEKSSSSLNVKDVFTQLENKKTANDKKQPDSAKKTKSSVDLVSVYRNLTLFDELGLAHKFQDGSFSVCKHEHKAHDHQHVHFISHCLLCGTKSELKSHSKEICALAKNIKKISSPLKTLNEIIIQGHCAQCLPEY